MPVISHVAGSRAPPGLSRQKPSTLSVTHQSVVNPVGDAGLGTRIRTRPRGWFMPWSPIRMLLLKCVGAWLCAFITEVRPIITTRPKRAFHKPRVRKDLFFEG